MPDRGYSDPPPAIVEGGRFVLGRFSGAPGRVNMLDVEHPYHYSIPRAVKNWRLKEWTAFQLGDARRFMFATLYNAKSFGLVAFLGWDRERRRQFGFKRLLPGNLAKFPDRFDGAALAWRGFGVSLSFSVDAAAGVVRMEAERRSRDKAKRLRAAFDFALNSRQTAPQSVCLPLGLNRAMYSTKVLMPMSGELELAGEKTTFEGPDSMGVIDDHKGFYPYRMRYDWIMGFGLDSRDRRVGFNLTDNQVRDQDNYNENCLWINSRVFALPPVKVTRPQGPDGEWIIQDMEGMVDLVFKPEMPQRLKIDMGFIRSDYDGPFGSFRGILKSADGERVDAEKLYGMGEKKILHI